MKLSNFFIWCAGSDTELLKKCSQREKIKHIGFGSLVLIPAVLAFVSMSYALSTVSIIANQPILYYLGGLIWALIIFSFDRFIVSTHIRKINNRNELRNPAFFLRLGFALILGIVISHPLVMLYFDGSIADRIKQNVVEEQALIQKQFDDRISLQENKLYYLDSLERQKEKERNAQELVVAKEIDGEVIKNSSGQVVTTGLYGKGPSAEKKIKHLQQLQKELDLLKEENSREKANINQNITTLRQRQDSTIKAYSVSFDYLKRELALEQLKEENSIVGITQYFLILLFVLVDILPFIFKTFSPFGMYERILYDDAILIKQLDNEGRKVYIKKLYSEMNL